METYMKSVDNENSNNWLGFSLSPQITMEQETHLGSNSSASTVVPNNFFNYSSFCYGVEGENGGFFAPLSFMPLKSDGSLCIMEALNRSQSQGMVTSSTPKLEDFFGGSTMATPQYDHDVSMNNIQENFRQQQQQQFETQHYPFFTGYSIDEQNKQPHVIDCNNNVHRPAFIDIEAGGMKNWESGSMGAMGYGDLQSLSLSMSPGSQSSCVTGSHHVSSSVVQTVVTTDAKKRGPEKMEQKQIVHRKSIDTFGQRTSQYRGVTRHRWTGRYEAHLWDNSCKKEGQTRKGRQVYLGGYDMEDKAARAYDQAALKYWGPSTHINFPVENYEQELEAMKNMTRQEYVAHLRRKSSGFSRGASMYRGVTRHHQHGRWQARIGRVAGNKDLYLGTFSTQEEAAEAYDIAAIKFRGANAVTNFDVTKYNVESIIASSTLLSGESARRSKDEGILAIANDAPSKKKTGPHLSNASSLVTSLNSSREASPDKSSSIVPMLFALPPPSTTKNFSNQTTSVNNWVQSTQLRPRISLPHLPIFTAWSDA